MDLIITNKEGLMGNVKLKVSFDCRDHELVELEILETARMGHNKLRTLDFRRADFGLILDNSGVKHPSKEKVSQKCQQVCMDEQGAPG